ncbi:MAG: Asp-tRNA(Asn)/Glu-tRNA(Gln) amidotransferase subunit GatC [Patescibacteria group bacterium]
MALSLEEVQKIAKLSRLSLTEEETETYKEQLGSILEYVQKLQEVNTDTVPELQNALDITNVFREDVVEACDPTVRQNALNNFSNRKDDLLEVPAVFEGRTE